MPIEPPKPDQAVQFLQAELPVSLQDVILARMDKFEEEIAKMKEYEEEMTRMKATIAGMQNSVGENFQEEMAEMKAAVAGLQVGSRATTQSTQMQQPEVPPARRQQVSWNALHGAPLTVGTDQYQQAADTDDLTVDKWNFKQSCWDGAAFAFDSQIMTCPESLFNVLLLLVDMVMQSFFIIIVWKSLASTSLGTDAIDGFHMWRTNVGHDVRFANPLTQESLSSRVCRGDTSLHLSDTQTQTLLSINSYLYDNAPFGWDKNIKY